MPKVDLFAEDRAHELFVSALLRRIFAEEGVEADVSVRSAVGGHGRALTELKTYQRVVKKGAMGLARPDLLVVTIDGNCKGYVDARNEILRAVEPDAAVEALAACPDPHVERWFFADPGAFNRVVGIEQQPGRRKCERGRYKAMLKQAVLRAGHFPSLDGLEFAADLVGEMDLYRAGANEPSLGDLINGVRSFARRARA